MIMRNAAIFEIDRCDDISPGPSASSFPRTRPLQGFPPAPEEACSISASPGIRLVLPLLFLLAALAQSVAAQSLPPRGAPVLGSGPVDVPPFVRVIDGDTFEAWINDNRVGVGVLGVRVPAGNTPCGIEAAETLNALVANGVHLEEDSAIEFDSRLRRMYYVTTVDGRSVAKELVRAGVAWPDGSTGGALAGLETAARHARRGCLWRDVGR